VKLLVKTTDLLDDFPSISMEDHLVVIVEYIDSYYKETRVLISWGQIPYKIGEPLKPIRKRKAVFEEVKDVPQKPPKKAKIVKTATSGVQKKVAKFDTYEILPTRTRGGASIRAYSAQPSKKPQKQPKSATRKLVLSKYTEKKILKKMFLV